MNIYQRAWLEAHPNRSRAWLEAHLADGFEIHHRDHDPNNHTSDNLVLIDGADHKNLHGSKTPISLGTRQRRPRIDLNIGELAYYGRRRTNRGWNYIAERLGIKSGQKVERAARHYAWLSGNVWPLPEAIKGREPRKKYQRPVYRGY